MKCEVVPLEDVLALGEDVWDRCAQLVNSPFMSWAWHYAWHDTAAMNERAAAQAIVLFSANGDVSGIVPVGLYQTQFRRATVTALMWAIQDIGSPDHLDIPAVSDADFDAMLEPLAKMPWDIILLRNVAEGSRNVPRLCAAFEQRGYAVRSLSLWQSPYLSLPDTWDGYLAGLGSSRRQSVRRKERILFRRHSCAITHHDADDLDAGWRSFVALHERRWRSEGLFAGNRMEALHRQFAGEMAARGRLWLSTLDVDGEAVASWYGFSSDKCVYYYQSGRDPRWKREGVGSVLMGAMIRRAIERGFREFDFLRGDEAYKYEWTAASRSLHEWAVFRPGVQGVALRVRDWLARVRAGQRRRTLVYDRSLR